MENFGAIESPLAANLSSRQLASFRHLLNLVGRQVQKAGQ
jgi:hypothetical protein